MANTSRSYPKRARQSTGNQETTNNTYSTARRPRRSAPYSNNSGTSRATASSRNLLSQTTRGGTNLLIDESTLGVPCQKYTKVLRYTSSPLDIPYFGSSPNGTFKILTWVKVSELTEEERKVYYEEEKRKEEQRLVWKKELEKKSADTTAVGADKEKEQSEEEDDKKRKREYTNEDDDTSAATGDNDKADNDGTSIKANMNKSEVDITVADGDDIDINKGIVKEEDGDVTMDDDNTGTNNGNDETGSKSTEEQRQDEQKEEVIAAKEESGDVAAVAAEETADKSKEEEKEGGEASNSAVVNMDVEVEMNDDGANLDKATKTEDNKIGGDTKEEEEVKSIQETSSQ